MDADALTIKQQNEMMRKGLCFRCKKPGHISKNCPSNQNNYQSYNCGKNNEAPAKNRINARELYMHIRTLTKDNLDEEQKQELYGMMDENQGF